jgi:predicted enzyme related to lactoylglutathione lyase
MYMLMVEDMDRAVGFYRDILGLKVKSRSPKWTELQFGDAVVALHSGGKGVFEKTGLNFAVKHIDSACEEVESGGGSIVNPPMERPGEPIRLAEVVDTEGNAISLFEYTG